MTETSKARSEILFIHKGLIITTPDGDQKVVMIKKIGNKKIITLQSLNGHNWDISIDQAIQAEHAPVAISFLKESIKKFGEEASEIKKEIDQLRMKAQRITIFNKIQKALQTFDNKTDE